MTYTTAQCLSSEAADRLAHFIHRRMTLKQLSVLHALRQHKTIANASISLSMTAANVSLYIRELEQQLDTALFHRNNGVYTPTAMGLLLTQLAQRVANECQRTVDRCRQAVLHHDLQQLKIGYLGASMSTYAYALWHRILPQMQGSSVHIEDLSGLLQRDSLDALKDPCGILLSINPLSLSGSDSDWHAQTFVIQHYHVLQNAQQAGSAPLNFLLPRTSASLEATLRDHVITHYPDHSGISFYNNATAVVQTGLPHGTALVVSAFEFNNLPPHAGLGLLGSVHVDHLCHIYTHHNARLIPGLAETVDELIALEHAA